MCISTFVILYQSRRQNHYFDLWDSLFPSNANRTCIPFLTEMYFTQFSISFNLKKKIYIVVFSIRYKFYSSYTLVHCCLFQIIDRRTGTVVFGISPR